VSIQHKTSNKEDECNQVTPALDLYQDNQQSRLSADDDKRFIIEDGISTYAHGHYKIT